MMDLHQRNPCTSQQVVLEESFFPELKTKCLVQAACFTVIGVKKAKKSVKKTTHCPRGAKSVAWVARIRLGRGVHDGDMQNKCPPLTVPTPPRVFHHLL